MKRRKQREWSLSEWNIPSIELSQKNQKTDFEIHINTQMKRKLQIGTKVPQHFKAAF